MRTTHRVFDAQWSHRLDDRVPEFRAALEQQRRFRLEQLQELDEVSAGQSPAVDDVHDRVSEILRAGAATALTEVEDALDRLDAGRYGTCERCTTQIPCERLEILPMSRYCMRCQHALERGST